LIFSGTITPFIRNMIFGLRQNIKAHFCLFYRRVPCVMSEDYCFSPICGICGTFSFK
jgi:hypothetical protein